MSIFSKIRAEKLLDCSLPNSHLVSSVARVMNYILVDYKAHYVFWKQVHDEVILEGPSESAETAKAIVVECMSKPFDGKNILTVELSVDAKCAQNWYAAK